MIVQRQVGLGWISAAITGGLSLTTAIISAVQKRKQAKQAAKVAAAQAAADQAQQTSQQNYLKAMAFLSQQQKALQAQEDRKRLNDIVKYGSVALTVLLLLMGSKDKK